MFNGYSRHRVSEPDLTNSSISSTQAQAGRFHRGSYAQYKEERAGKINKNVPLRSAVQCDRPPPIPDYSRGLRTPNEDVREERRRQSGLSNLDYEYRNKSGITKDRVGFREEPIESRNPVPRFTGESYLREKKLIDSDTAGWSRTRNPVESQSKLGYGKEPNYSGATVEMRYEPRRRISQYQDTQRPSYERQIDSSQTRIFSHERQIQPRYLNSRYPQAVPKADIVPMKASLGRQRDVERQFDRYNERSRYGNPKNIDQGGYTRNKSSIYSQQNTPQKYQERPEQDIRNDKPNNRNERMMETPSKRSELISKSKILREKFNQLSGEKKYTCSSFSNFHEKSNENPADRIERLRNQKERVYESPFKNYPREPLRGHNQNHQLREFEDRPYPSASESCQLKRSPIGAKSYTHMPSGQSLGRSPPDNDCMDRISSLNSKINERISSIISAFDR